MESRNRLRLPAKVVAEIDALIWGSTLLPGSIVFVLAALAWYLGLVHA